MNKTFDVMSGALAYPASEGLPRAERRAAPKPARVPSGDRSPYPASEGLQ